MKDLWTSSVVLLLSVAPLTSAEQQGAEIGVRGPCHVDTFVPGATLYTNRPYVIAECPQFVKGKRFLRSSIDLVDFECASPGLICVLTPDPVHKIAKACSRHAELEARGFKRIDGSEVFQLFGEEPYDLVRTYQKDLEKGERFQLKKWAVVVGFSKAKIVLPARKPWTNRQGELLYNGIRLPKQWPPDDIVPYDTNPMPVPYLDDRPDVVPIDVGRQLSVDDFLIEKTDLIRSYHLAEKYERNPILTPQARLEMNHPRNAIACPKDGGDLSSLRNRPVRFRFRMSNGSLYAFWVSRDQSGRSDGYVAAGGPGYTGPIDTVGMKALAVD